MSTVPFELEDLLDPNTSTRAERRSRRIARGLSCAVAALGLTVLIGWWRDVEPLLRVAPGMVTMKPNAALGLVLAGAGLVAALAPRGRTTSLVLAGLLTLLGAAQLLQELFALDLGIDQMLFREAPGAIQTERPGRMSPLTAFTFVAIGAAILLVPRATRRGGLAVQILAGVVLIVAIHAALGYVYDEPSFYRLGGSTAIAAHTAVGLAVVAVALWCSLPKFGLGQLLADRALAGHFLRRMLPAVMILPILLALIAVQGKDRGWLGTSVADSLHSTASIAMLTGIVVWAAWSLRGLEASRQRTLELLRVRDRALASADCGFVIADARSHDHPILYVNPAFERLNGYERSQVLGSSFLRVLVQDDETLASVREAIGAGRSTMVELRTRRRDGTDFWSRLSVDPVRGAANQVSHLVGVQEDVTQRVESAAARERLLAQAISDRAAARKAMRARDVMLATVSHELRSPLNTVALWSSLLRDSEKNDRATVVRAAQHIRRCVEDLDRMIGDLLDVSRMTTGRLELELAPLDLDRLANEIVAELQPACSQKDVKLSYAGPEEPVHVEGDRDRLSQVVRNLIGNALKFSTEGGRIDVQVGRENGDVELVTQDDGCGIPPEKLRRVFEPFWQVDSKGAQRQGGMGLGLFIVRELVERHGGTIGVESEGVGRGTLVRVRLPVVEPVAAAAPAVSVPPRTEGGDEGSERGDVLLVEDDVYTLEVLALALGSRGLHLRTAGDAESALERIAEHRPRVLVSDIMLPGLDGIALVEEIRRREDLEGREPMVAIAVSGRGGLRDRSRIRDAGFDDFFPKPVDLGALSQRIRDALEADEGVAG